MARIRQLVERMGDLERADLALGLAYVVDNGIEAEVIPAEIMDGWYRDNYAWFGREDVLLHAVVPSGFRELMLSGLTAPQLSSSTMAALEAFEVHRDDPQYDARRAAIPRSI